MKNDNNATSLTSISLLDCTHLYEKFAVREVSLCIHHDTSCVYFPHQHHSSTQYKPMMIYAVLTPIHMTYCIQNKMSSQVTYLVNDALGRRASNDRLLDKRPEVPQLEVA